MNPKKKNIILGAVAIIAIIAAGVIAYTSTRAPKIVEIPDDEISKQEMRRNNATAPGFKMPEPQAPQGGG
jgi:hypothetical protein